MDYHSMSLVELKNIARDLPKGNKIKQYYIKSRQELIQLLTLTELPKEMKIQKLTLHELRQEAREKGVPNVWKYRRNDLCDLLYPSPKQENQNNDNGYKHDNPEKGKGENVGV